MSKNKIFSITNTIVEIKVLDEYWLFILRRKLKLLIIHVKRYWCIFLSFPYLYFLFKVFEILVIKQPIIFFFFSNEFWWFKDVAIIFEFSLINLLFCGCRKHSILIFIVTGFINFIDFNLITKVGFKPNLI